MLKSKKSGWGEKDAQKPIKAPSASVANEDSTLSSFKRKAGHYQAKYKLQNNLASLRAKMVLCAVEMSQVYGDDFQHCKQLMGASDMVQDWIENIRLEYDPNSKEN